MHGGWQFCHPCICCKFHKVVWKDGGPNGWMDGCHIVWVSQKQKFNKIGRYTFLVPYEEFNTQTTIVHKIFNYLQGFVFPQIFDIVFCANCSKKKKMLFTNENFNSFVHIFSLYVEFNTHKINK
jgi:hypothetical protein